MQAGPVWSEISAPRDRGPPRHTTLSLAISRGDGTFAPICRVGLQVVVRLAAPGLQPRPPALDERSHSAATGLGRCCRGALTLPGVASLIPASSDRRTQWPRS